MSQHSLLIQFPGFAPHSEGRPDLLCFNPGLAERTQLKDYYTPQSLPLSPAQCRTYLADVEQLLTRFSRPGEVISLAADQAVQAGQAGSGLGGAGGEFRDLDAFVAGATGGAQEGMAVAAKGQDGTQEDPLLRAQMTLLVAWAAEVANREAQALEARLAEGKKTLQNVLGLESMPGMSGSAAQAGDPDDEEAQLVWPDPEGEMTSTPLEMPWGTALAAMLAFLPPEALLVVSEEEITAQWHEAGLSVMPLAENDAEAMQLDSSGATWTILKATGHELVSGLGDIGALGGHTDTMPWLDQERTVLLSQSKGESE